MKYSAFGLSLILAATVLSAQSNPVPLLNVPLEPPSAAPGSPDVTLTLNGAGFVSGSVVRWNNTSLSTTFVSGSQLKAIVPISDMVAAGTASVTVLDPTPGGGASNVVFFPVHAPVNSLIFTTYPQIFGANYPASVSITGDFNGDGKLDVAGIAPTPPGSGTSQIFVALGNGDGTFADPGIFNVGNTPIAMVAADFNGDGKLDLAVANERDGTVSLLLGNGDGTFQTQKTYTLGSNPVFIFAGDFNRDGKLDLVTTSGDGDASPISLLLGNGDGTFQTHIDLAAGGVSAFGIGDFNRDGNIDMVTADASQLSVLLGNGDGTFQTPLVTTDSIPGNCVLNNMVVADVNGDSLLDLVIGTLNCGSYVLAGNGDGTFAAATPSQTDPFPCAVGDFSADGLADILGGFQGLAIGLRTASGSYQDVIIPGNYPGAVGDFNGDGLLDVASSGSNVGPITYAVQVQGSHQDFTLGESISSLTITPPAQTHLALYVFPVGGFAQTVSLSCTGAPAGLTCALSPSSVTLDGTKSQTVMANLSATGKAGGRTQLPSDFPVQRVRLNSVFAALLISAAFALSLARPTRHMATTISLGLATLLFAGLVMIGCGTNGGSGGETTPGSYTLTLTGTSTSGSTTLTHPLTFTLIVQ